MTPLGKHGERFGKISPTPTKFEHLVRMGGLLRIDHSPVMAIWRVPFGFACRGWGGR